MRENQSSGFRPGPTQTRQYSHRSLKLGFKKKRDCTIQCSKNKGSDQLCCYCTADLHLCFRICRLVFFLCGGSLILEHNCKNNWPVQ